MVIVITQLIAHHLEVDSISNCVSTAIVSFYSTSLSGAYCCIINNTMVIIALLCFCITWSCDFKIIKNVIYIANNIYHSQRSITLIGSRTALITTKTSLLFKKFCLHKCPSQIYQYTHTHTTIMNAFSLIQ